MTYSLGNADYAELLELLRVQVGEIDTNPALLVRVYELCQNLKSTGVDFVDLSELAESIFITHVAHVQNDSLGGFAARRVGRVALRWAVQLELASVLDG